MQNLTVYATPSMGLITPCENKRPLTLAGVASYFKSAFEVRMIDKNWSIDEAIAANKKFLADNPSISWADPSLPFSQWEALYSLDACKIKFETGHQKSLMLAIRICANHDLPLPDWAARAYIKAFDRVNNALDKSWDSVFGLPYPKGTHLSALRKKHVTKLKVWHEVKDVIRTNRQTPIDEALFEKVGKKYGIGKTLASEYYHAVIKQFGF